MAETVAWIHALIVAWIKERFEKEVMTTNLGSRDLLVAERFLEPGPYLIIDWVGGKRDPHCLLEKERVG